MPYDFYKREQTVEEIVENLGGGDLTEGSCSSLAFAYVGNRANMQIFDFRGGKSRAFFSKSSNIEKISKLNGVESYIEESYNDYTAVNNLLKKMVKNKEYYFMAGRHASIIRKTEQGFEYLELQSAKSNGFKQLTTERLKNRFSCQKSHTRSGIKLKMKSLLIDIATLSNNKDFKTILEYINTSKSKQKKGIGGRVK